MDTLIIGMLMLSSLIFLEAAIRRHYEQLGVMAVFVVTVCMVVSVMMVGIRVLGVLF